MWSELAHPLSLSKQQGHLTSHHTEMICGRYNVKHAWSYKNELHTTSIIDFSCVEEFSFSLVSTDPFLVKGLNLDMRLNISYITLGSLFHFDFSIYINTGVHTSTVLNRIELEILEPLPWLML